MKKLFLTLISFFLLLSSVSAWHFDYGCSQADLDNDWKADMRDLAIAKQTAEDIRLWNGCKISAPGCVLRDINYDGKVNLIDYSKAVAKVRHVKSQIGCNVFVL